MDRFDHGRITIGRTRYGALMWLRQDEVIGRSLSESGAWAEPEVELVRRYVGEGAVIVDGGANIGTFTVPLARAAGTTGRVVAIEPQRLVYMILCGNVALNGLDNVRCIEAALGDKPGAIKVPATGPVEMENLGAVSLLNVRAGEDVPQITLDGLNLARCDVIKLDLEGMEAHALLGAVDTLSRCRPVLHVEANRAERTRDLLELISSFDYRCWWDVHWPTGTLAPQADPDGRWQMTYPDINLLCLPGERGGADVDLPPVDGPDDTWLTMMERVHGLRVVAPLP